MRRGGARREVTERVTLRSDDGRVLEGWALNVSRGGLRAILEDKVILGQKFEVGVGTDESIHRVGRIVWIQEEPDGVIVGIEFTGTSGTHKSVPPPPPGALSEPSVPAAGRLPSADVGDAKAGADGDPSSEP
ncbi:MAG: PilZ domain-containing protein [Labilithrix sp.]|nr:PilZ domain-containing protein [Labilithrix sp.]MCW5832130.1 PilZ domain-containing protein [Labilithrix sp.]